MSNISTEITRTLGCCLERLHPSGLTRIIAALEETPDLFFCFGDGSGLMSSNELDPDFLVSR